MRKKQTFSLLLNRSKTSTQNLRPGRRSDSSWWQRCIVKKGDIISKRRAWKTRSKKTEAKTEIQETQIKHLEAVRAKLDRRVHVLEALLRSEHELADQRIKRLTDELQRKQPMTSLPTLQDQSS